MQYFKKLVISSLLFFSIGAQAAPIAASGTEGFKLFVTSTSNIIATFLGTTAMYSNDLFLDNGHSSSTAIFNNHGSAVGATVNLGSFAVGTELLFRMHVNNTKRDYFTGPAERNPDGKLHNRAQDNWKPNQTLVSFEDLFNGAFHFNDLSFSLTNVSTVAPVQTPVPGAVWLLAPALVGLLQFGRRKA